MTNMGRQPIYGFRAMKVGDVREHVPADGVTPQQLAQRIRSAASTWRHNSKIKVSFRVQVVGQVVRVTARPWKKASPLLSQAAGKAAPID